MNKLLCAVIALLVSLLTAIGGWWVSEVNDTRKVVTQLQFKDLYLNGQVKAAPVELPSGTPPPAKAK